jgi:hypothetical protein
MKGRLFLLATVLFATGLCAETTDRFSDPSIREIQRRHDLAAEGDKDETKKLCADLEKNFKDHPDDCLIQAYLGSVYTLRSRDAFPGPGKLKYLKDGLKIMDAAVESDPDSLPPRFVRAVNNYSLPGFCMRRDTARADFKRLLGELEKPDASATLDMETRQAIYYFAGLSYKQTRDPVQAREAWQRGWNLAPTSSLAGKIQKQLSKLKS